MLSPRLRFATIKGTAETIISIKGISRMGRMVLFLPLQRATQVRFAFERELGKFLQSECGFS